MVLGFYYRIFLCLFRVLIMWFEIYKQQIILISFYYIDTYFYAIDTCQLCIFSSDKKQSSSLSLILSYLIEVQLRSNGLNIVL